MYCRPHLPKPPRGRTLVVGGGKAAASMAPAVEKPYWPGDAPLSGLVVTRYRHALPTRRIAVVEASHSLPDDSGEAAALRMPGMALALGQDDLLLVLISGGATSVQVGDPNGRGGRNTHFLLALAVELQDIETAWALACDTDGIDGTEDNAGALVSPDTLARATRLGLDAELALHVQSSYDFFAALDDLVVTGPTRTSVNDYRVLLQLSRAS